NYWKKLWELVKKLSLENRVEYIGEKYGADKQDLFRNAGCLALISKSENFGNVVIEAMSYNTPVIVSKGVGISDTIEKTNSGLVIEPSAIQLAESVKKMENEELRKAILSNANKLIQNKYSIEFVVKETKKIYQICINEKHTNIRAPKCV
ncbi:MAG: glycosyltransferase family 4 protein, partial [Flavobacteriaceae bacterium]|nr:glycosyltransferase family 4 protein [Flavobacteriaceae bacterium]